MGWFASTLETIKTHTGHDPVECPRGCGMVSFVGSFWFIPPMAGVSRACPIGGVSQCGECHYASNPDAFRLAEQLAELERLRDEGQLSRDEYRARRQAVLRLHVAPDGKAQFTAAWILGPLGALVAAGGSVLALRVAPGFWGLTAVGLVSAVLGLSFWMLARSTWPPNQRGGSGDS